MAYRSVSKADAERYKGSNPFTLTKFIWGRSVMKARLVVTQEERGLNPPDPSIFKCALVPEMVYGAVLETVGGNSMWVRVPPSVPNFLRGVLK